MTDKELEEKAYNIGVHIGIFIKNFISFIIKIIILRFLGKYCFSLLQFNIEQIGTNKSKFEIDCSNPMMLTCLIVSMAIIMLSAIANVFKQSN